jgi:hypothetical protein
MRSLFKLILLLCITYSCSFGQGIFDKMQYHAEAGVYVSSNKENPFWLRSNQYGIVPLKSGIGTIRGGIYKEYDSTYNAAGKLRKFNYGFGVNVVANLGQASKVILPEAYVKLRYKAFEFYAGRRKEIFGLVDTSLTSGSYIWSGNALPLPKIQISIPNYIPVLWDGLVAIKGSYGDGFFGNTGRVKKFYLHQKSLYGRIGRENAKVHVFGGFNHQVQWGGNNPQRPTQEFANNIYAYLYSVIPLKKVSAIASQHLTKGDLENRVGNQLGTLDMGVEYKLSGYKLFIYRQNLYEQGAALLRLANIRDGLNGISFENLYPQDGLSLRKVLFEFFYSKSQGDDPLLFTKVRGWELENYFTHYQYIDGWTYMDKVIGTPLITTRNETLDIFPKTDQLINNNRIKSYYLAFNFQLKKNIQITARNVYSSNGGVMFTDFNRTYNQFSVSISGDIILKNLTTLKIQTAYDIGEIYPKNVGLYLGVKKIWR